MSASSEVLKALAVTAQLTGSDITRDAARVLIGDLDGYTEKQILDALKRVRHEHTGRLTVQAIVSRIDDGRPGVEEAWAMIPRDETATVCWTDEIAQAWGQCSGLDDIAARMAFKEVYGRIVRENRAQRKPPKWMMSLGSDPAGRQTAIEAAVTQGKISAERAQKMLPSIDAESHRGSNALEWAVARIGRQAAQEMPIEKVREKIQGLRDVINSRQGG